VGAVARKSNPVVALAVLLWVPALCREGTAVAQTRLDRLVRAMTEAERYRSTLFQEFSLVWDVVQGDGGVVAVRPHRRPYSGRLAELICAADSIMTGSVEAAVSPPTSDGRFIFTDYSFRVSAVLHARAGGQEVGRVRILSRPGGRLVVDGATFAVDHEDFPPMVLGSQYLVFASFVARTDSFLAKRLESVYRCTPTSCLPDGPALVAAGASLGLRDMAGVVTTALASCRPSRDAAE
jgi:hypothetical protein